MKFLHADIKLFLIVLGALAFTFIFAAGLCPIWQDCAAASIQNPDTAEVAYSRIKSRYDSLVKSPTLHTQVMEWQKMIREFRAIYFKYPDDPDVTPKILYMMARCYNNLYDNSKSGDDLEEAIKRYEVLVERFPDNRLADDALYLLSGLYLMKGDAPAARKSLERIIEQYPDGDQVDKARKGLASLGDNEAVAGKPVRAETNVHQAPHDTDKQPVPVSVGKTHENIDDTYRAGHASAGPAPEADVAMHEVTDIRHWSVSDYTRIVIDTTGPVTFKEGFLPANKPKGLLPRFYIDIRPAVMKKGLPSAIDIRDGLLKGVRAGQFDKKTVRVVCDLGGSRKIKAFYLEDPFRVIIDAFSEQYAKGTLCPVNKNAVKQKIPEGPPIKGAVKGEIRGEIKGNRLSITQQLGLCVRRVVIDPGHGGKDPGAIGPTGLQEKDVTLRIANKVAERLKDELGCKVILTRHDDVFLPLEQRTAIANANKADLFVSIHTNAAPNPTASGVETYFLNFAVNEDAMRVAAFENATSSKRIGELQSILNDIFKNAKVKESSRLAAFVQKDIINSLNGRFGDIKNLGVKQAPFFVLIGAQMPSILVETSFISNPKEETLLKDDGYLDRIADGIVSGIKAYSSKDINFVSSALVR
ncbi:MAG: N-acetylmuramoyl-L-alanine amidase [Dissulfurimicrobium sp.]|uniref:N-acetylmuramoyl-L-alanine amidase n=1 Tax=Dissulfurimicrobium sp. TaxID=2022436 RepID=UPI004049CB8D